MSEHQQYAAGGWAPAPQWAPPPRRHRRTLPVLLGVVALVVLVAVGLVAWSAGRSTTTASAPTPMTATRYQPADPASAAAAVEPGLVDVDTVIGYQGEQAAGTGIVLTADGEVLTNNHVVSGATRIQVTDIGNGRTYTASVVGYDRSRDVAVLQLKDATGLTTAPIGDSSTVAVGDPVVGVGNAGGVGGTPSTAAGTVTALDQPITASDESGAGSEQLTGLIQTNADIQAGDSGGPLVNSAGQVVGMDTAASAPAQTTRHRASSTGTAAVQGFAIPIDDALSVARQIESGAASSTVHIGETAMLGVSVTDSGQGAVVGQVLSGGPAEQAGLVAGDVIVAVNGQSIDSATALTPVLDGLHPGDSVSLTWVDGSQQQDATVTLATGPTG